MTTPRSDIQNLQSAWKGHEDFAIWLVETLLPRVTVELGCDYGFSLFAFAVPRIGRVVGIDSFEYDPHAGWHPDNYKVVMDFKHKHGFDNVEVIKGWFSEVAKTWTDPIDILHIDGLHTHEAITEDWTNWSPFVTDRGVILMHDVVSFPDITRFYNQITLPKAYFQHSYGLGIVTRNEDILSQIASRFPDLKSGNII